MLGEDGAPGTSALSTMKTLLAPTPPATSTSFWRCSSPSYSERLVSTSRFRMLYWMERFCRSRTSAFSVSMRFLVSSSWLLRRLVAGFQRALDRRHFGGQLAVDLGDLVGDLHHGRIARLEGLELLLVLGDQRVALRAQPLNDRVGQQLRHV